MRVVKELEHGLLVNFFQYQGKDHLAVTILSFFDLDAPDNVLQEPALWPFVQAELGQDAILDMGMPKPTAEVLLRARCYAPEGEPIKAHSATFRVGEIQKTLAVYGDRDWVHKPGTGWVTTDPKPFAVLEIDYARAFGGPGYAKNPSGRGYLVPEARKNAERIPLPNIIEPEKHIGSPDETHEPAGFGPLDFTWPQRASKLGTYDDDWMQNRWPGYPDNLDWTAFNAAPPDQWRPVPGGPEGQPFFHGDEVIGLLNMHPERPSIASKLPGLRQRCFINQHLDWRTRNSELVFKEIPTRLDTVWLFPHGLRGVAIFRGAIETMDDEGLDIGHLYISSEPLSQEPKPLEHYYEIFKKRLDRGVEIDMTPFQDVQKKLAEAREKLADVPRMVNDAVARMLGKAPKPVLTPEDTVAQSLALIDKHKIQLADAEKSLTAMKAQFGHLVKIDTSGLAKAAGKLDAMAKKIATIVPDVKKKIGDKLDAAQKKAQDAYNNALANIDPKYMDGKGLDPNAVFEAIKNPPRNHWQESGMRFLYACRKNLENDAQTMASLKRMGFTGYTLKRHWLGLNPAELRVDPATWGLEKDLPGQELVIPVGFVIPTFADADLISIAIRPADALATTDKDTLVTNAKPMAMVLSAGPGKPLVRVKDGLEAILLAQETADICAVAALPAPDAAPTMDKAPAAFAATAPQVLAILYAEERDAPETALPLWQKPFPQAEALLLPAPAKNIFAARKDGLDLWKWITDALKPGLAPAVSPRQAPEHGAIVPKFDAMAIYQQVKDATMARVQPKLDKLEAAKAAGMAKAVEALKKVGKDPSIILNPPEPTLLKQENPFAAPKQKLAQALVNTRKKLQGVNQLTPDIETKLSDIEKSQNMVLDKSQALFKDGMTKLAAAKEQLKDPIPAWSKKMLADAGFDPADRNPLRLLTREEVIERHAAGLSLAGKNLSGVDLSDLDLTGVNLRKAMIEKTNFTRSILDNADLSEVIGNEAVFAKASLKNATLRRGILVKANFTKAELYAANLENALLKEADLSEADLSAARLGQTVFEKAILKKATLTEANAKMGYFLDADLSQAVFNHADLTKAVFLRTPMDRASFVKATVRSTIFLTVAGDKVNFAGADMHNARILQDSALPHANFSGVNATRASFMDSDLGAANFHIGCVDEALIENCQLQNAKLANISAKKTRFNKSDLTGADLSGVNLIYGSLRKARLPNATLAGANLYSTEFYRTGVGKTNFDGANLKKTKLAKFTRYLEKEQQS